MKIINVQLSAYCKVIVFVDLVWYNLDKCWHSPNVRVRISSIAPYLLSIKGIKMTYSYRNGGNIKDYWPDDDESTIYRASCSDTLQEIMDMAKEKWPEASLEDIEISSEKIHTSCLTYDCYDPSDYTDFIVIKNTKVKT